MQALNLGGLPLAYGTAGDHGPPIVFVAGAAFPGGSWRCQTDPLAADHRVAWFDHRGVGRTPLGDDPITITRMAQDALALADHLGWRRPTYVGHSMGGRVIRRLALDHPDRVARLVLITSVYRRVMPPPLTLWPIMARYPLWASARRQAVLDQTFTRRYQDTVGRDALAARLESLLGMPPEAFPRALPWHQVRAMRRDRETDHRLAELDVPTLVIGATHDKVLPPSNAAKLAGAISGARLEVLADCGHGLIIERADDVNALIRGFVADDGAPHPR